MLSLQPFSLLLHLPTPADLPWIPRPAESHHVFGAGLLFVAVLLAVESLAGKVWHRSMVRRMLFPGILIFLGWGMVAVAFIEPNARLVHVTMGLPMIAGGWAEARYRMGELDRRYADALVVPALMLASVDTLGFHLVGPDDGNRFARRAWDHRAGAGWTTALPVVSAGIAGTFDANQRGDCPSGSGSVD